MAPQFFFIVLSVNDVMQINIIIANLSSPIRSNDNSNITSDTGAPYCDIADMDMVDMVDMDMED